MNQSSYKSKSFYRQWGWATGLLALAYFPAPGADIPDTPTSETGSSPVNMKVGPFDFEPRVTSQAYYDDNILYSPVKPESDLVWELNPGLQAVAGDKLSLLSYRDQGWDVMNLSPDSLVTSQPEDWPGRFVILDESPQFKWFTDHPSDNYIGNIGKINAVMPSTKMILGASFNYDDEAVVAVEGLQYTGRRDINGTLSGAYFISDKTSIDTAVTYEELDYDQLEANAVLLLGYSEWRDASWLNYQWSEPLNFGAGLTIGTDDVAERLGSDYGRLLVRARYQYAAKLSFDASAGSELRSYESGKPDTTEPVFDLGARYDLLDRTAFTLDASRSVYASVVNDYNYVSTGVSFRVDQGLTDRVSTYASADYRVINYDNVESAASTLTQDYYSLAAGVKVYLTKQLTGSFFYNYSDITQNSVQDITENRVGLELTWKL